MLRIHALGASGRAELFPALSERTRFLPPAGSGRGLSPAGTARRPRRSSCRCEWPADQRAARACSRRSRVSAPAGAARAAHGAPGPEAHLQRLQAHVILRGEAGPEGGDPPPPRRGPGRRGLRGAGSGRSVGLGAAASPALHLGRRSAEQRERGRQAEGAGNSQEVCSAQRH